MKKTKPVIVIHIDALRREYVSDWILSEKFKQAGYQVILSSRTSTSLLLKLFTPDIVILSHVFTIPTTELASLFKRNVRVYINEVEGTMENEHAIATTYLHSDINYDLFAGIFVWNHWTRDWLLKNHKVNPQRVHAIGSIRNAIINSDERPAKKVVGILARFEIINIFDKRHTFENLFDIDPEDGRNRWYFDRGSIDAEAFSIISKIIGILIKKGVAVSLRAHPNENLKGYKILRKKYGPLFSVDKGYDISEWLSKVSVVVGPTSTGFTEAYISHIPIISTQGIQKIQYADNNVSEILNRFSKSAYMPTTVSSAIELITTKSLQPVDSPDFNDFLVRFYSINKNADSIDEIVKIVNAENVALTPPRRQLPRCLGLGLRVFIDVAYLCRALFSSHPIKKLRLAFQYNFNAVLHRPNLYMKSLRLKLLSK